jgi:hypothetical protein
MKGKIPLAIAAMTFSGVLAAAGAQYGPGATPTGAEGERVKLEAAETQLFAAIDRDGDGYITQEELLSWFEEHDRAGDGRLSQGEFAAFMGAEDVTVSPEADPTLSPHEDPGAVPPVEPAGPQVADPDQPAPR